MYPELPDDSKVIETMFDTFKQVKKVFFVCSKIAANSVLPIPSSAFAYLARFEKEMLAGYPNQSLQGFDRNR
jgi:hypothetical protein